MLYVIFERDEGRLRLLRQLHAGEFAHKHVGVVNVRAATGARGRLPVANVGTTVELVKIKNDADADNKAGPDYVEPDAGEDTVYAAPSAQQAIDYAEILQLPFAYSSNGREIIEHDFVTGSERTLDQFPGPDEL